MACVFEEPFETTEVWQGHRKFTSKAFGLGLLPVPSWDPLALSRARVSELVNPDPDKPLSPPQRVSRPKIDLVS